MQRMSVFVISLAVLGLPACRGGTRSGGSGNFEQALAEAQPMFAKLAAVRDAVPRVVELQPTECPKQEFQPVDGRPVFLLRLPWNTLVRASGGDESLQTDVSRDFTGFAASSFSRITGLYGPNKEAYQYPNPATLREAMEELERHRFAAVLHPTRVQHGVFQGGKFEPGFAEGWIVIVRLADAQVVCQAPVRAENGSAVSFRQAGGGGSVEGWVEGGKAAIKQDLEKRTVEAVDRAIQGMTGGAR